MGDAAEKKFAFDVRMVGKWYKAEMGETIHIFPEDPPRMKMSFSSSGHYNFEPNCVYTDGDALCWEINDEYYRMVYRVRYEDGRLCGVYTQFGKETPVIYERVSDTPEDGEYLYLSPNEYVPDTKTTRRAILAEYADYASCDTVISETTYALGGPVPEILSKTDPVKIRRRAEYAVRVYHRFRSVLANVTLPRQYPGKENVGVTKSSGVFLFPLDKQRVLCYTIQTNVS